MEPTYSLVTAPKIFDWDIEDELDGLIDIVTGSHPDISTELPGVLLEEKIPVPVDSIEDESIDNNVINDSAAGNSGIVHTPGVCDENGAPTPILTPINNPTLDSN